MILEKYRDIVPDFDEFIEVMNTPQPYWIRVNTLKIDESGLVDRLHAKGFSLTRFKNLNAYRIDSMPVKHPGATMEHSLGYYYVQDLASMMPVIALSPEPGETVLDMAAAPGSKSTMIAQMMNNIGTVVANDVSLGRIKALASNMERMGITNTILTKKNAAKAIFKMKFDKILVDAPCTSEGTIRKAPMDAVPAEQDHINYSKIQKAMLANALRHLNEDGKIVYSTCTFNPVENEEVVRFAVEELNLELVSAPIPVPAVPGVRAWRDMDFSGIWKDVYRIYPHKIDTGGMFIAVLRKE